jgi:hypothetical protein
MVIRKKGQLSLDWEEFGPFDFNGKRFARYNQLILYIDFEKGQSDGMELDVQFSPDGHAFYSQQVESFSPDYRDAEIKPLRFLNSGKYRLPIPCGDHSFMVRVRALENADGAECGIVAIKTRS